METLKKFNCIYKITNILNNKVYIGSTTNYRRRKLQHINHLNKECHRSKYLQRSWLIYGANSFKFEVLERVRSKSNLIQREQHYLDIYKSYLPINGYNTRKVAERNTGLIPWNKGSWKALVSEKQIISTYESGKTLKEVAKLYKISVDSITFVLKKYQVIRTKAESRALRDKLHPEFAKAVGKLNKGKLSGKKNPNFGKQGYWQGKSISEETKLKAKETRVKKHGAYFSKKGFKNLNLFKKLASREI